MSSVPSTVDSPTAVPISPNDATANPGGYTGRTFNTWREALNTFNRMFCYVRTPGVVVRLSDLETFKPDPFVSHQYCNWRYKDSVQRGDDSDDDTPTVPSNVSIASKWLNSKERNECERMTYAPGLGIVYKGALNRWRGMGSKAIKGDVTPWNELLDFLFPKAPEQRTPEQRTYFEQWLAYPLKHLGTKLKTAVVLYSRVQGIGKNILIEAVEKIYGDNAIEIGESQLKAGFNPWQKDRQFVVGDEVQGGGEKRRVVERLKMLITSPTVEVNEKNIPQYTIPNCSNFIFLSNNPDPFYIADQDRRFWAWEIPQQQPLPDAFYRKFHDWKETTEGIAALYWHLLHVDTSDFNPDAKAPMTELKREMVELNRTEVERWLLDLRYDNQNKPLLTANDLESLWRKQNPNSKSGVSAILRALKVLDFKRAYQGKQLKIDGKAERLWVVAPPEEAERLLAITEPSELAAMYAGQVPGASFLKTAPGPPVTAVTR